MEQFICAERHKTCPSNQDLDMFALVILTHGHRNNILYGVDGSELEVEKIRDLLSYEKFPYMMGKPKLIFIQACQGGMY